MRLIYNLFIALPLAATISKSPALCGSHPCTITLTCASATCNSTENTELQTTLDDTTIQCGDTVVLESGRTWTGAFTFGRLPGGSCSATNMVNIQASLVARAPAAGTRVTMGHAPNMAKLKGVNSGSPPAPFTVLDGATPGQYLSIRYIEFEPCANCTEAASSTNDLIRIGQGAGADASQTPNYISLRHVYAHGTSSLEPRNGVILNGRNLTVQDSHFGNIKQPTNESHGMVGWASDGPFLIENNWIEVSSIGILWGGADPGSINILPANGTVRYNIFTRPSDWFAETYQIKNSYEHKVGNGFSVMWNLFERNYRIANNGGQTGAAINLKINNYRVAENTATLADLIFMNNRIDGTLAAFTIQGSDAGPTYQRRSQIVNNLFTNMGCLYDIAACAGLTPFTWNQSENGQYARVVGNTFALGENYSVGQAGATGIRVNASSGNWTGITYSSNIGPQGEYFIKRDATAVGGASVDAGYATPVNFTGNVFAGATTSLTCTGGRVCSGNSFPSGAQYDANYQQWVSTSTGDYSLAQASPYYTSGHLGQPPGVDMTLLARIESFTVTPSTVTAALAYQVSGPVIQIPCTIEVSTSSTLSTAADGWTVVNSVNPNKFLNSDTDAATTRARTFTIGMDATQTDLNGVSTDRRLATGTLHYGRLACGGDVRRFTFTTL